MPDAPDTAAVKDELEKARRALEMATRTADDRTREKAAVQERFDALSASYEALKREVRRWTLSVR